jgi:hypothetical protein
MSGVTACKVCRGVEPAVVDKLLVWGRAPRWIAPKFGHTRRAVARHERTCLVGARRAKVEADLMSMAAEEGGVHS